MTPRNHSFSPSKEPFRDNELQLEESATTGPFSFLNPTKARYHHPDLFENNKSDVNSPSQKSGDGDGGVNNILNSSIDTKQKGPVTFLWRSRDNRKGRHPIIINPDSVNSSSKNTNIQLPKPTTSMSSILENTRRMLTTFKPWDISWLVAQVFTWGSVTWCVNAFFALLPLTNPNTKFPNETLYAGGISAFVGAIVFFEFGSILLMLEAVNENNAGCFGWALEQIVDDVEDDGEETETGDSSENPHPHIMKLRADRASCTHHHQNKRNLVGKASSKNTGSGDEEEGASGNNDGSKRSWRWFPSWHELKTHYFHQLGFLACFAQLFGATIFGISGFTALPGIQNHLNQRVLNGVYWIPQIVGGSGFIVSGILFMLETQKNWYTPAWDVLGWHIGFWNFVGALGFTLCGALGPAYGNSGAQFEASVATFWGSWAFLLASILQLYESVQKHPVTMEKS